MGGVNMYGLCGCGMGHRKFVDSLLGHDTEHKKLINDLRGRNRADRGHQEFRSDLHGLGHWEFVDRLHGHDRANSGHIGFRIGLLATLCGPDTQNVYCHQIQVPV